MACVSGLMSWTVAYQVNPYEEKGIMLSPRSLKFSEAIEKMKKVLKLNQDFYGKVVIKSILEKGCAYENILTVAKLGEKAPLLGDDSEHRDYGEVILVKKCCEPEELLESIKARTIEIGQTPIKIAGNGIGYRLTGSSFKAYRLSDDLDAERSHSACWPVHEFTLTCEKSCAGFSHAPLIAYGCQPFADIEHAIEDWVGIEDFLGQQDARLGKVTVVVPSYMARIHPLELVGKEGTQCKIVTGVEGTLQTTFEIQLLYKLGDKKWESEQRECKPNEPIHFDLRGFPEEVQIYLLSANDGIVDYHVERKGSLNHGLKRRLFKDVPPEIRRDLTGGENERVEYKPFIKRDDNKETEIIETVVAFANADGGRIYIGIGDHGEPEGVTKGLVKDYRPRGKPDVKGLVSKYCDHLKRLIEKQVLDRNEARTVKVRFDSVEYRGKTIVVVEVKKGENPPYYCGGYDIFIRRGATNKRASPEELQKLFPEWIARQIRS
ncbi:MAG: hypothetical protein DRP82_04645 [Planctomycetota bacterium]|nr:MAG: hypothetical protein DRP82_04645 [Planctomycetota bacterium]